MSKPGLEWVFQQSPQTLEPGQGFTLEGLLEFRGDVLGKGVLGRWALGGHGSHPVTGHQFGQLLGQDAQFLRRCSSLHAGPLGV